MTEGVVVTVADLLPSDLSGLGGAIKQDMGDAGLPGFAWKLIAPEAHEAVKGVLNCDVYELLAKGWCAARELHQYTDVTQHPPGERSVVFLGEHSLTSVAYPEIVVSVGPKRFRAVRLTLDLKANFRAAALTIKDRHIVSVNSGDCSVSAQLKYGEINLHDELKSRDVSLPGRLEFEAPGLAIR